MQDDPMTHSDYDKAFEDYAWEEMRRLLDAEMPVRRRRRFLPPWWLFGAGVAAGLLIALVIGRVGWPEERLQEPSRVLRGSASHEFVPASSTGGAERKAESPSSSTAAPPILATSSVEGGAVKALSATADEVEEGSSGRATAALKAHSATTPPSLPTLRERQPVPPRLPAQISTLRRLQLPGRRVVAPAGLRPRQEGQWLLGQGGRGNTYAGGVSWVRWRKAGTLHRWRWGYGAAYRYRRSRHNGLTILGYASDVQELNAPNSGAVVGRFRNGHLAEAFLFAERQIGSRWWVGVGLHGGLLLHTGPTRAGLLSRKATQMAAPAEVYTSSESVRSLVTQGVAPFQLSLSTQLRYQLLPRAHLFLQWRRQLNDPFPHNGLPDRPTTLEGGVGFDLHR